MVGLGLAGASTSLAFLLFNLRNAGFDGRGGAGPFCFIDEVGEKDDPISMSSFDDHCLILSATGGNCSVDKSTDIITFFNANY